MVTFWLMKKTIWSKHDLEVYLNRLLLIRATEIRSELYAKRHFECTIYLLCNWFPCSPNTLRGICRGLNTLCHYDDIISHKAASGCSADDGVSSGFPCCTQCHSNYGLLGAAAPIAPSTLHCLPALSSWSHAPIKMELFQNPYPLIPPGRRKYVTIHSHRLSVWACVEIYCLWANIELGEVSVSCVPLSR